MGLDTDRGEKDISQKEILSILKISGNRIKRLRDEHLATDDWYYDNSKPGRPSIYYRQSGIAKLQLHYAAARILPLVVPRFAPAVMLFRARNPKVIWARIKLPTGEWVKGGVFVTPKLLKTLQPGKPFKVQVVENDEGKRSYRHEKLCP